MADTNINYQDQLNRANTLHDQLNKMYDENRAQVTTAEAQTENLNKQSQAAYKQQQIESQKAQNQFAQNQQANQLSALDAIRRSNASAIANGANAGLSAANQLSAILGLQEETSDAATKLANGRKISLTGAITAEGVIFDGTQDIVLNVTAVDASKLFLPEGETLIIDGNV